MGLLIFHQVAGRLPLGVQSVGGDNGSFDRQRFKKRLEYFDVICFAGDLFLCDDRCPFMDKRTGRLIDPGFATATTSEAFEHILSAVFSPLCDGVEAASAAHDGAIGKSAWNSGASPTIAIAGLLCVMLDMKGA